MMKSLSEEEDIDEEDLLENLPLTITQFSKRILPKNKVFQKGNKQSSRLGQGHVVRIDLPYNFILELLKTKSNMEKLIFVLEDFIYEKYCDELEEIGFDENTNPEITLLFVKIWSLYIKFKIILFFCIDNFFLTRFKIFEFILFIFII